MWQLNRSTLACTKNSCAFPPRRWERATKSESFCLVNHGYLFAEFKYDVYFYRTQFLKCSRKLCILMQAWLKYLLNIIILLGLWKKYFSCDGTKLLHATGHPHFVALNLQGFFCYYFFFNLKHTPSSIPGKLKFSYITMARLPVSISLYLSTK